MAIEPGLCPLCGDDNECARVAGRARCWCYETTVPRAVLERVPEEARALACVCRACAKGRLHPDEARRRIDER